MTAWNEQGGKVRWIAAVGLIGLSAGSKYPGVVTLLPLAWVMWHREGGRGLMRWTAALLGAFGVFVITTPFALIDFPAFVDDLAIHALHISAGHLGQSPASTFATYSSALVHNLGPAGLALLLASVWLAAQRPRNASAVAVWVYLGACLVPFLLAHYALEYYAIPLIPAAAILAAVAALRLPERLKLGTWATAGLLLVLLAPVLVFGARAGSAPTGYTQVEARQWLQARLRHDELVMTEAWGPRLLSLKEFLTARGSRWYASVRPELRTLYEGRLWFHVSELPFIVSGRTASRLTSEDGRRHEIEVFPSALEVDQIAYDPRVIRMADLVVTSGAVRSRFEADTYHFGTACRIYGILDSTATVEARFDPHDGIDGPVLTVYRIGDRTRAALAASGPLPALWWAESIPRRYRQAVTTLYGIRWEGDATLRADGTATLWVRTLAGVYGHDLQPFANDLAVNLVDLGRCDAARPLVEGTLLVSPHDPQAVRLYEICTGKRPGERSPPLR
jgi:hypothetical protein